MIVHTFGTLIHENEIKSTNISCIKINSNKILIVKKINSEIENSKCIPFPFSCPEACVYIATTTRSVSPTVHSSSFDSLSLSHTHSLSCHSLSKDFCFFYLVFLVLEFGCCWCICKFSLSFPSLLNCFSLY